MTVELADGTKVYSSHVQSLGGHHLHYDGASDVVWRLAADLVSAREELRDLIVKLRAAPCSRCGESQIANPKEAT